MPVIVDRLLKSISTQNNGPMPFLRNQGSTYSRSLWSRKFLSHKHTYLLQGYKFNHFKLSSHFRENLYNKSSIYSGNLGCHVARYLQLLCLEFLKFICASSFMTEFKYFLASLKLNTFNNKFSWVSRTLRNSLYVLDSIFYHFIVTSNDLDSEIPDKKLSSCKCDFN